MCPAASSPLPFTRSLSIFSPPLLESGNCSGAVTFGRFNCLLVSGMVSAGPSDHCSAAGNELEDQRDYGQYQEDMNKTSQRVAGDEAEEPQNQQNNKERPEHRSILV